MADRQPSGRNSASRLRAASEGLDEGDSGRTLDAAGQKRRDAVRAGERNSKMNHVCGGRHCWGGRQGPAEAAGRTGRARMSMVHIAALGMAVMVAVSHHQTLHVMAVSCLTLFSVQRRHDVTPGMRRPACHGDGRERLNRKAQGQQHDDEEFAPVRHGSEV